MPRQRAALPDDAAAAHPPSDTATDVYTMAEAARLKGVSYHTVSRAVRRGKLPATRLGRMALIASDDLREWRPMRERAPLKYRRRKPNPDATPALLDLAAGERVELAQRLSALYELVHSAAAELPLPDFLSLLTDRLAAVLGFRRVALWGVDTERDEVTRLASYGPPFSRYPSTMPLARMPVIRRALQEPGAHVIDDVEALSVEGGSDVLAVHALFVAPLRIGDRTLGVVVADMNDEPLVLSTDQLTLAQGLANQAALAMDQARLRAAGIAQAERMAAIIENVGEAVFACDAAGRLTTINAAGRALLGVGDGPLDADADLREAVARVQRRSFDGTPIAPDDVPLVRAYHGEQVRDQRHIVIRADGRERVVSVNAQPIRLGDRGGIVGAVAVARDITAEREAAVRDAQYLAQLEATAQRAAAVAEVALALNVGTDLRTVLRTAIAHLTDLLDGHQGAIFFREADGRMIGQVGHVFDPSAIEGLALEPVTLPTTMIAFGRRQPVYYTYDEAAPSERSFFDRLGFRAALIAPLIVGEELIGAAYVTYQSDDTRPSEDDLAFAGALANQCAVAIDKTRLMNRIDSAHQRLLAVVDQLPQGVIIISAPDGHLVLANRAAERLWGGTLPSAGEADASLADAAGTPFAADDGPLSRTLRTGEPRLGERLTVLRSDGTQISVVANHAPVRDGTGRIIGAVSVLQDVAELRALDRAKDEFLSIAAHELRNPLTSLHGNLQLLLRRMDKSSEPEPEIERLRGIIAQSGRLSQLVARLLDVSRAELGRLDLTLAPTDATAIVDRVVEATKGLARSRAIVVDGPDNLPVVWDAVRVEQILNNLVGNAVKYAPSGEVRITVAPVDDETVRITVRDHGPGIPDPAKARLFERYFRADDGHDDGERTDGLGIGLYISRTIARALGGELTVADAEGGGARFDLTLPRDGTARPPAGASPSRSRATSPV